ncbi:MAG: hypothetical protein DRI24_20985, partial [Deltaproteobacteria bacterium]
TAIIRINYPPVANDDSNNTLAVGDTAQLSPFGNDQNTSLPFALDSISLVPPAGAINTGYIVHDRVNKTGGTGGITPISNSTIRAMYLDGKYSNSYCQVAGSKDTGQQHPNCAIGTGKAKIVINSYNVDYYFRKPKVVNLTAVNQYRVDSTMADLGATNISINDAVINWIAVGE